MHAVCIPPEHSLPCAAAVSGCLMCYQLQVLLAGEQQCCLPPLPEHLHGTGGSHTGCSDTLLRQQLQQHRLQHILMAKNVAVVHATQWSPHNDLVVRSMHTAGLLYIVLMLTNFTCALFMLRS